MGFGIERSLPFQFGVHVDAEAGSDDGAVDPMALGLGVIIGPLVGASLDEGAEVDNFGGGGFQWLGKGKRKSGLMPRV